VYGWDSLVLLQHLLDEGLSKTAIAQRLGVSRRVLYHWLATGQLTRDIDAQVPRRASPRATQLDPYTGIITARLETFPELSAVRLFDEVRAAGYPGGITQVRDYVARVRPRPEPEPLVRFETAPGHQAQVDFAEFRLPWGKRYALLVVLGYSRLLWLKFYPRQTLATVISGLEEAFTSFGGVPAELLFDQMKAVILADQRADGGKLLEHPEFLRFAAHWGFRIRACRPYRAKTKGKVERPIRYLRSNFFYGREFIGDADLDAQRLAWLDGVANVRVHRTTQCMPRVRFETEEIQHLRPLAERAYRPLVLPLARTTRRTVAHLLAPTAVPAVAVERRGLGAYRQLVESHAEEVA
jgi:transposase